MVEGKTEKIVLAHAEEIIEIRKKYPAISEQIEAFKKDMRCFSKEMFHEIKNIDSENDQELVRVLIINDIHKLTDEIFLA